MEDDNKRIGLAVRGLREAAGLTQAELAKELADRGLAGMHPQTITKIEGGQRALRFVEALEVAQILGVDPGDLRGMTDGAEGDVRLRTAALGVQALRDSLLRQLVGYIEDRWQLADYVRSRSGPLPDHVRHLLQEVLGAPGDPDWIAEEALSIAGAGDPLYPDRNAAGIETGFDAGKRLEDFRRLLVNAKLAGEGDRYTEEQMEGELHSYPFKDLMDAGFSVDEAARSRYWQARRSVGKDPREMSDGEHPEEA